MTTTLGGRVLPAAVRTGGEFATVARAWPLGDPDGQRLDLRFEGRDTEERVRAGRLTLAADTGDGYRLLAVELAPPGRDPRLPTLATAAARGEVVVHRLGRRAVVRAGGSYLKVVRPRAAAELAERTGVARARAQAAGLDAPEVLSRTDGTVELSVLPGESLHLLGGAGEPSRWDAAWQAWAQRWPAFARGDQRGLPAHTAADESVVVEKAVRGALAAGVLTDPSGRLGSRVEQVLGALGTPMDRPGPVVSHRDLHDKQVLVGERVGVLDLDTVALAEPALDLANLAVHARLRVDQGLWSPQRHRTAVAAIEAVAGELAVPAQRMQAYAAATVLRLAALYAFRPRWQGLARTWAAEAADDESFLMDASSATHPRAGG